jgi:hypothetical protein
LFSFFSFVSCSDSSLVSFSSATLCSCSSNLVSVSFLELLDHPHPLPHDDFPSFSQFAVYSRFHFFHSVDTFFSGVLPLLHVHHLKTYQAFVGCGST